MTNPWVDPCTDVPHLHARPRRKRALVALSLIDLLFLGACGTSGDTTGTPAPDGATVDADASAWDADASAGDGGLDDGAHADATSDGAVDDGASEDVSTADALHDGSTQQGEWTRQFGTDQTEAAYSVSVDGVGNVFVAGDTFGTLPGQTGQTNPGGGDDAFVRKYDDAGNVLWTRQLEASSSVANSVTVDAQGDVYLAGSVFGALSGQTSAGSDDAFARSYDAQGNVLWTTQFGSTGQDEATAIAVDGSGNVYVGGDTNGTLPGQTNAGALDAVVLKYDPSGTVQWTRQFGTGGNDAAKSVCVDASGNLYAVGYTQGTWPGQTSAGNNDAFVRKYDPSGTVLWTRQFGSTGSDEAFSVALDGSGNIVVVGSAGAALSGQTSAGMDDAFVVTYDPSGTLLSTLQFGTSAVDACESVSVIASGDVYVAGFTGGALPGQTSAGGEDAFVRKYNAAGTEQWTHQFGSSAGERAYGVSAGSNAVYLAGYTIGTLPGQTSAGGWDVYVEGFAP